MMNVFLNNDNKVRLELYHHLLMHQLMPWLERNNDPHLFRAFMEMPDNIPLAKRLLKVLSGKPESYSAELFNELKGFAENSFKLNYNLINQLVKQTINQNDKIRFYAAFIGVAYEGSCIRFHDIKENQTLDRLMLLTPKLLEDISLLNDRSIALQNKVGAEDQVILYLTHFSLIKLYEFVVKESMKKNIHPNTIQKPELVVPICSNPLYAHYLNAMYHAIIAKRDRNAASRLTQPADGNVNTILRGTNQEQHQTNNPTSKPGRENEPEYFSTSEAAKLLGLCRQAVAKNIKNGRLKAQKIGKKYRIPYSAMEAFKKDVEVQDRQKLKNAKYY